MKSLRLVKIRDNRTDKEFYQIQKKTLLFGWIAIGRRDNDIKGTFNTLTEATRYYDAYSSKSIFDIEVIK
jgi:hypothetical protein